MRIYTITQGEDRYHINLDALNAVKEHSSNYVFLQFGDAAMTFSMHGFASREDYLAAVNNLLTAWRGST